MTRCYAIDKIHVVYWFLVLLSFIKTIFEKFKTVIRNVICSYDACSACILLLVAAHSFASFVLLVKTNLCLIILTKESESGHVIIYSIFLEIVIMSY